MRVKIRGKTFEIKDCKYSSGRGLMFDSMNDKDGALIYGNAIWMPFVRYELDLLFLKKNKIVDVKRAKPMILNPKTWKIFANKNADRCLELKSGLVKVKKGDVVRFE